MSDFFTAITATALPDLGADRRIDAREKWARVIEGLITRGLLNPTELSSGDPKSPGLGLVRIIYDWGLAIARERTGRV